VFAVVGSETGRHLLPEPPDDPSLVAYAVDPRVGCSTGAAGGRPRRRRAPPGARDAAAITPHVRTRRATLALAAGATVFVAAPAPGAEADGMRYALEPPRDGTLRFAVRPGGTVLVGDAAREEPPRRVADAGWATRTGPQVRALHRLAERGARLSCAWWGRDDWGALERLVVPRTERRRAASEAHVGLTGEAAAADAGARWRARLARLSGRRRSPARRLMRQQGNRSRRIQTRSVGSDALAPTERTGRQGAGQSGRPARAASAAAASQS
jgi:hypothetical protein